MRTKCTIRISDPEGRDFLGAAHRNMQFRLMGLRDPGREAIRYGVEIG